MNAKFALRLLIEVGLMPTFFSLAIIALPFLIVHKAIEYLLENHT